MHVPIVPVAIMFGLNRLQIRLSGPPESAGKFSLKSAILPVSAMSYTGR
jgi:hypothetical protein